MQNPLSPENQHTQSNRKWQIIAAVTLLSLAGTLTAAIFLEGWNFQRDPHCYLYSALYKYHTGTFHEFGVDEIYWPSPARNFDYSPLYFISNAFGSIGKPTPPWFRLTGVFFFVVLFLVTYFATPHSADKKDRLISVLMIASMPLVISQARTFQCHLLHLTISIAGAGLLLRSKFGMQFARVWPFYLLPAIDMACCFLVTNCITTSLSLFSMYLFSLYIGWRQLGIRDLVKRELPRLALCITALAIVLSWRFSGFSTIDTFNYYFAETATNSKNPDFNPLYFPIQLVVFVCGIVTTLFALFGVIKRYRPTHYGFYLCWLLIPLVIFTLSPKKTHYYIWYTAPAIGFLAAGSALRFYSLHKTKLFVGLLALSLVRIIWSMEVHFIGPDHLEYLGIRLSQGENKAMVLLQNEVYPRKPDLLKKRAKRILGAAEKCGDLENRPFILLNDPPIQPYNLLGTLFVALKMDQRPDYRIVNGGRIPISKSTVVVELDLPYQPPIEPPYVTAKEINNMNNVAPLWETIRRRLPLQVQTEDFKVYCIPDSETTS